jgi:hypothetical protein
MITAIDFGCHTIRAAHRSSAESSAITLYSERSEYVILPNQESHRQALLERQISYGACEDNLLVFGNRAGQVRWLSRQPCAPLFTDGRVPTADAPARQILHVLTQAMLPESPHDNGVCCFTVPGGQRNTDSTEFLARLIRMHGFVPAAVSSGESALLASGSETNFTAVTIVLGAESSEVSITRYGVELASETIAVGANWIDAELAKQFKFQVWDASGECYLDLEAVREWKHDERIHLRHGVSERERTLSRLYGTMLDQTARITRRMLHSPAVKSVLGNQRLAVVCAGGPTRIAGFSSALAERFVDHDVASQILSVKTIDDPTNAVVRGLLIYGELESRRRLVRKSAA